MNKNLKETIEAREEFIQKNSNEIGENMREMEMTIDKIESLDFLNENFNHCATEYSKIEIPDKHINFNGKLDNVFKILQKFVKDECFDSDFSMLDNKQTMNILKTWWNKNKSKFTK